MQRQIASLAKIAFDSDLPAPLAEPMVYQPVEKGV
jgi:hypothetical protein